jgi:hypothetical protein
MPRTCSAVTRRQVALHDREQLVQRQVDTVVGQPALRKAGADAVAAVAANTACARQRPWRPVPSGLSWMRAVSTFIACALLLAAVLSIRRRCRLEGG